MSEKKVYPDLTLFDGGLNNSANPLTRQPNEWLAAQNAIVAKTYGFKNQMPEQTHVAQSRPPMRLFNNSTFDFSVAGSPTEVKPLVGSTQAAADDQPNEWQSIALGIPGEGWTASYSGSHSGAVSTVSQTPGLTQSDTNNQTIGLMGLPTALGTFVLETTLNSPLVVGQIGNNNTQIYLDYRYLFELAYTFGGPYDPFASGSPYYPCGSMVLKIGTDANNYLEFQLPVGSSGSPPPNTQVYVDSTGHLTTTYGVNRFSALLRNGTVVGTKSFGELMSNLVYIEVDYVIGTASNPPFPRNDALQEVFDIDHPRLDVDYLGFFGDFTVGQPYQQVTLSSLDPFSQDTSTIVTYTNGFYAERRLSIGAGCVGCESALTSGNGSVLFNYGADPLATPIYSNPTSLILDVRVEGFGGTDTCTIKIQDNASGSVTKDISAALAAISGDGIIKVLLANNDGIFGLANIDKVTITVNYGNTPVKVFFSNLRLAPYNAGFQPITGNIRDSFLYDPLLPGASTRFTLSCGDSLFLGNSLLGSQSWTLDGGFTNWSQSLPQTGLQKRFVFGIAPNPNYVSTSTLAGGSSTLSAQANPGATSIVLNSATGLVAGMPIQIGSQTGNVDLSYIGGLTVPLTFAVIGYLSGTAVSWGNALPGNQSIFLNSAVNITPGEQIVIDPNGVNPEIKYVSNSYAGGSTIPLQTPLEFSHSVGASVTWANFAEPQSIGLFVNGSDGYYSFKIISYPLPSGGTYQYPVVEKIASEAYSTLCDHQGYTCLAGDPNHPERIVFTSPSDATIIPAQSFEELPIEGNANAGDIITALKSFEQFLIASRRTDVAIMYGDSINNFDLRFTSATRGALSQNHLAQAGRRIFFLAHDGVYELSNFTTVPVSDKITAQFQLNDYNRMLSGFIFWNPIREVLVVVIPRDYTHDPVITTSDTYTFSLEKEAWGWIFGSNSNPRNTPFSGAFYGGGGGIPAVFFSSTTMIEWDNGPDTTQEIFSITMAPHTFGTAYQQKVFDKLYTYFKNFVNVPGNNSVAFGMGLNNPQFVQLALGGQLTTDLDGMLELFCPSGTFGKGGAPMYQLEYSAWTTPVMMQAYGVSYFPGEEL